jgi:uncharacterized protein YabE (DUF348 family)/3D (Asp-Asp-Asp) domain-containing protein
LGSPARPARFLKTRYTITLLVAALVALAGLSGFVWAEKNVTLLVDGQSRGMTTKSASVASLLAEAGVSVASGDLVSPAAGTSLSDGEVVVVRHAIPVALTLDGRSLQLRVLGRTVADALVTDGLDPTGGLQVSPSLDTPLQAGMRITATDVFVRVSEEQVALPFSTVIQGDPTLPLNARVVVKKGSSGSAVRVWQTLVTAGVAGPRTVKAVRVISPAVQQLIRVGTKRRFRQVLSAGGQSPHHYAPRPVPTPPIKGQTLSMESTAYTLWDAGCNGDLAWVRQRKAHYNIPDGWGIIAVDPSVIKLGTKVFVEGYGYAVAADTGGAIHGNIIDVCFWGADPSASDTHLAPGQKADAFASTDHWGRRYGVRVTILK